VTKHFRKSFKLPKNVVPKETSGMNMFNKIFVLLSLSVASVALYAAEGVAVTVNEQPISQAIVDAHIRMGLGEDAVQKLQGAQRDALVTDLVGRELLVQEAKKAELDKTAEVQAEIADKTADVLSAAYMRHWFKQHQPSDEELQKEYDRQSQLPAPKQFKTRHIVTATEQEAKAVIAALSNQANFAELAAQKSIDTATKSKGGELDWMLPHEMFPPYLQAVVALQKGGYTQSPVQTHVGWHVIMLDDVREAPKPLLEKVKPILAKGLAEQQWQKHLTELRSGAKIEATK
jgi:peptidyl-prolyl cis-trans isomerase C